MKASEALRRSKMNARPKYYDDDLKNALRAIKHVSGLNRPNNTSLVFAFENWDKRRARSLAADLEGLGYNVYTDLRSYCDIHWSNPK